MQMILKKHGPSVASHMVRVNLLRSERDISLKFTVHRRIGLSWDTSDQFSEDYKKNWGLWNHDVVEAFLQLRSDPSEVLNPYLEIQVSPLGQKFALIVKKPREDFFIPDGLNFSSSVSCEGRVWETSIHLTLPDDLSGDHLYAGLFSCLSADEREYYALEPNPESRPDFHRPDLFIPLDFL
jgi:hypothetical protein